MWNIPDRQIRRKLCLSKMKLWKFQAAKKKKFRNATPHMELPPARVLGIVSQRRILCQNTAEITMACVIYCCVPFKLFDKPAQNSDIFPEFAVPELHMPITCFVYCFPSNYGWQNLSLDINVTLTFKLL
jgi:hypothetical protein